jgi:osmotically-inducible protein OsmY
MNIMITRIGLWLLLSLGVAVVLGCSANQSPQRQVNDAAITSTVKSQLATDIELSTIANVDVNTTDGAVTLTGQVPTPEARRRAEEITRNVDGVVRVTNNIQVAGS